MSLSILRLFLMLPVAAGGVSCSALKSDQLFDDEAEAPGSVGEVGRRATLPSYLSPEVARGRMEGILFGDTVWRIPKSERPKVEAVATYLKTRAERVILAGGAEVTSAEYARQLGQQRALEVKEALVDEGIPASRIVTSSFGLDLPGKGGDRVEFGFVPTGEKPL